MECVSVPDVLARVLLVLAGIWVFNQVYDGVAHLIRDVRRFGRWLRSRA